MNEAIKDGRVFIPKESSYRIIGPEDWYCFKCAKVSPLEEACDCGKIKAEIIQKWFGQIFCNTISLSDEDVLKLLEMMDD